MPTKETVNRLLARTTGYHLAHGEPGALATRAATAERRVGDLQAKVTEQRERIAGLRERLDRSKAELAAARAKLARGRELPSDFDDDIRETIQAVREYTMTGTDKLHALITATKYVAQNKIPGDIVECGVWRGGSMHAVARTLTNCGDQTRELYLFDTFEGMTEPTEADVRQDGMAAADLLATKERSSNVWAFASLEDVRAGFKDVPYPSERIHFVKGRVEDTVPAEVPDTISILRLDTDWYESTAHELLHMWDRLVPGGVLMIDDYGHWKGSRQATDEFIERTGAQLLLIRMNSGRVAIKQ